MRFEPLLSRMTERRLVVSYPADLSKWGRDQLATPWFRAYLRRELEDVGVGEILDAFLDVGCCGNTLDVPLRLERIDGDDPPGEEGAIEYEERAACGLAGGWLVQSRAGPGSGA